MLAEALVIARTPTPQPTLLATTPKVARGAVEPATVVDRVVDTEEVGVQYMEVETVDGATPQTAMDTENAEANVSIQHT